MDKNEILEKSRIENKNEDVFEKEVITKGNNVGVIVSGIVATIFLIIQVFSGKGINYGLCAVVFAVQAGGFTYKAIKLKRKHEIAVAIIYVIGTIMFSAGYIYELISLA